MRKPDVIPMHASPRCTAHSKRTGEPCKAPAVRGKKVCRMHGARGGAPSGAANGRFRHGLRTKKASLQRQQLREILREAKRIMDNLEMA